MKEYFTQLESEHLKLLKKMIGKTLRALFVYDDLYNNSQSKEFSCIQLCYFSVQDGEKFSVYEFWNELKPTQLFGDDYTQDDFACYHIEKSEAVKIDRNHYYPVPVNQIIKDIKIVTDTYHIKDETGFDSQLTSDVAVILELKDFNILLERIVTWTEVTDIKLYNGKADLQLELNYQFCYDDAEEKYEDGVTIDTKRDCWSLSDKKFHQVWISKNGYKSGQFSVSCFELWQVMYSFLLEKSESIKHKDEKLFQMVQEFDPDIWQGAGSADPAYYINFEKFFSGKTMVSDYGFEIAKEYLKTCDIEFYPDADKYLNEVSAEEWKNRIEEFLQTVHKGE